MLLICTILHHFFCTAKLCFYYAVNILLINDAMLHTFCSMCSFHHKLMIYIIINKANRNINCTI